MPFSETLFDARAYVSCNTREDRCSRPAVARALVSPQPEPVVDLTYSFTLARPEFEQAEQIVRKGAAGRGPAPYSSGSWWFDGNFLLDGHNNNACCGFSDGTFSLQFYGGGRVRWLFGDGMSAGPGGVWSIGAFPATNTPTLLDGEWHQLTLVRRWSGTSDADLELWIDGALVDSETSTVRTDMTFWWDTWPGFGAQAGWFWGTEKQAAIGVLSQYEDYKGLVDEVRFWSRAKSAAEIAQEFGEGWAALSTPLTIEIELS